MARRAARFISPALAKIIAVLRVAAAYYVRRGSPSSGRLMRTRLDMYCSLVLVFSMLVVISILALYRIDPVWGNGRSGGNL